LPNNRFSSPVVSRRWPSGSSSTPTASTRPRSSNSHESQQPAQTREVRRIASKIGPFILLLLMGAQASPPHFPPGPQGQGQQAHIQNHPAVVNPFPHPFGRFVAGGQEGKEIDQG